MEHSNEGNLAIWPQLPNPHGIFPERWIVFRTNLGIHLLVWTDVRDDTSWRTSTPIKELRISPDGWTAITRSGSCYELASKCLNHGETEAVRAREHAILEALPKMKWCRSAKPVKWNDKLVARLVSNNPS